MRRFLVLLSAIVLLLGLCVGASASQVSDMNILNSVSNDGNCQVTITVELVLDTAQETLTFPVPREAVNISLNGTRVGTQQTDSARLVDLSQALGGMTGKFSFSINYTLYNVVKYIDEAKTTLQMNLPLLAGFEYPIEQFQFTVAMPGTLSQRPSFYSGYHQKNIEKDLTYSVFGATITGRSWSQLKDHETLYMTLPVTEEMFPQNKIELPALEDMGILVNIFAAAALVYWLVFLRNFPFSRVNQTVAPEGFSAGQMGCVLSLQGADLSLMVFSWAQLGYLTISMDRRGHVYLDMQMEMGNERSTFEQRCFRNLFARKARVDTSSMYYIHACQDTERMKPNTQSFVRRHSGSKKLMKVLAALCGLFSGVSLAVSFSTELAAPWLVIIPIAVLGFIFCLFIQRWPEGVLLHRTGRLLLAILLCAVWLAIGYLAGQLSAAIWLVVIQLLAGVLVFFGGRRTESGKNVTAQVLSLRRYMKKLSPQQVQLLCRGNPEFFFDLIPYAMALHCSGSFARRFGKGRLPSCPYIRTADTANMTSGQWKQLMHQILGGMTARQRQLPLENLMKSLRSASARARRARRSRNGGRDGQRARRR